MRINPSKQTVSISLKELELADIALRDATRHVRALAGYPMGPFKHEGPSQDADHALTGILDATKHLGIETGAEWFEEVDVRDKEDFEVIDTRKAMEATS